MTERLVTALEVGPQDFSHLTQFFANAKTYNTTSQTLS